MIIKNGLSFNNIFLDKKDIWLNPLKIKQVELV